MSSIEYIARAVIQSDGKYLLCRGKGLSNYFFPGGHIEEGESAIASLTREIFEETGERGEVTRFAGVCENKYEKNGPVHEINLVFEVNLLSFKEIASKEDHLEFVWLTGDELERSLVFPVSLKKAVLATQAKEKPIWVSEGF